MRLSWNEIRARAARFAEEWKDAHYERGESQTFYNEFFEVFGVTRRRVASFEEPVKRLGDERGFIDLFWKGMLLVEQKSAGRDLTRAKEQALDYFPGLKEHELPRYVLVSDFQTFELYDLDDSTSIRFRLRQLPERIENFSFILGVQKRTFRDQDPVNIAASEMMGKLHDALKESGYEGHNLERFLVRLVFCLFADDTGIFEPRDIFSTLIAQRTNPDGSDTGMWISLLFEVLNTPMNQRQHNLDEDLAQFPYVNGDLFQERLPSPSFNAAMRSLLIDALDFCWDAISPAIFGSLFQSVMNRKERRSQGAHYTTEKSILKERFMHPFIGTNEFLYGLERWILYLDRASPADIRAMPAVKERIAAVRQSRQKSKSPGTRNLAETPTRFHVTVVPDRPFLVIPEVSSERRNYVPIGWLIPPAIPSNLVHVLLDADLWHFGILTSAMHMAWLRQIGGRLESRYRYSIGIVYNPFPWPEATNPQRAKIRSLARAVLEARAQFPKSTLADLYDVDAMPPPLRKAHHALDDAVDKLYRSALFTGDQDRAEHLFGLYEKLVAPLVAAACERTRRRRRQT